MAITYLSGQRIQGSSTAPNKTILTFNSSGSFTPTESFDVEYLVIGGGGGGHRGNGGGGGAGAYRTATGLGVTAQAYTVTVGAGGTAGTSSAEAGVGGNSVFSSITSSGGGQGGGEPPSGNRNGGANGNASGGGAGIGSTGGSGGTYGNDGGNGDASNGGAGGGGSGGAGSNNSGHSGGAGGAGTSSSITGSAVIRAGGGGGSTQGGSAGAGGTGGGGTGDGSNATANTGSGGGGNAASTAGTGGSGVVILSFAGGKGYSTTGSPTVVNTTTDEKTTVTDVPTGSQFEETDTRKFYQYAGKFFTADTDLKAYWRFNEASGDIINVSSSSADLGSGADLQVTGADYDTGSPPLGKSMSFNGSSDKAIAGTSLSQWNFMHSTTAKWTAVWWMKADSVTASQSIFGTNRLTTAKGVALLLNNNGSFSLLGYGGSGQWYGGNTSASYVPDTTTWHMYTVTLDNTISNGLNYTRDGANAHNVTNTASGSIANGNSGEQMTFGVKPDYGEEYFDGQINEVSIWDRILTSDEITELYNSGAGLPIGSPWKERGTAI